MRSLKIALLGGAALAATTLAACADELSDLKAEIAALGARMASIEAAPAVPQGFRLLSLSATRRTSNLPPATSTATATSRPTSSTRSPT